MLRDGYNIRTCDLCDRDTTVGFVRSIEVDMIGSNTSCDRKLKVLGFGEPFRSQIARMEAEMKSSQLDW